MPDPVSVVHQMTAVHRNVLETQGPVLQFDHPVLAGGAPSDVPVVVNLFGTTERVAAGLGVTLDGLDDLGAFLAALRLPTPPDGMRDALSRWPMLRAALATPPRSSGRPRFRVWCWKARMWICPRCRSRPIGPVMRDR